MSVDPKDENYFTDSVAKLGSDDVDQLLYLPDLWIYWISHQTILIG